MSKLSCLRFRESRLTSKLLVFWYVSGNELGFVGHSGLACEDGKTED